MSEKKDARPGAGPPPEPAFDRRAYLREIRAGLLRKLGLPEDTRPDQVMRLLEIKERLERKNQT